MSTITACSLPDGLVDEILVFLPAKSLLRFKSVRKDFGEFISSPGFIAQHLNHHQANPNNFESVMVTARSADAVATEEEDDWQFSYVKFGDHGSITLHQRKIECPLRSGNTLNLAAPRSGIWFQFLGSCNGLVCLERRDYTSKICIWNPATGEHRVLYEMILTMPCMPTQFPVVATGFGFDAQTKEYKFVRIFHFYRHVQELGEYDNIVEVWSFGNHYSRCKMFRLKLRVFIMNGPCHKSYTTKNNTGIFSWLAIEIADNRLEHERIVSFDMSRDHLQITHLPSVTEIGDHPLRLRCLSNIEEHAALTLAPGGDQRGYFENYDVWLLGEYGVGESWRMIYRIAAVGIDAVRIIGTRKNGVLLMESVEGRVFAYYPWSSKKVMLPIGKGKLGTFQVVPFVESLVPLTWV